MSYWDSSAVIPLFVEQAFTRSTRKWRELDREILTSWHSVAECASCFCRLAREGQFSEADVTSLYGRLQSESLHWTVVTPAALLEQTTLRLLRVHPLRAADALHLAAAVLSFERPLIEARFHTFDDRLAAAARREGFTVEVRASPSPPKKTPR